MKATAGRDLGASFLGNAWVALVQVAFVPAYIALLGVEAFGLIGVYAVLQASLALLDMGLTPTLAREAARFKAGSGSAAQVRDLVRSVEWLFLAGAAVIAFTAVVLAPWASQRWLTVEALSTETVVNSLRLMGLLVALRWLAGLYRGALLGLQQLVWMNAAVAGFATLRAAGVVAVLAWVSPTLEAFFAFQCAVTAIEAAMLGLRAWRSLPGPARPSFSLPALRDVGGFAGGMALMTALYLVLSQADKALLTALVPLSSFALYALASSVAGALNLAVAPIAQVAYARLNHLAARGGQADLAGTFHALAQLMTVAVAPAAFVLALFAQPVLLAWTGDADVARGTAPLLALLSIGAMLNAFMGTPYMVPLAHGRTRGLVALNALLLLAFLPAIYYGVVRWGAPAAAVAWIAINTAGMAAALPLVKPYLPAGGPWRWLGRDVAAPALLAAAAAAVVATFVPVDVSAWAGVAYALAAYGAALAAALSAAPLVTRAISGRLARR